ncbi:MAG: UDP-3-O-acyl-N-acetylglucosamine deacetylase, partial [Muribaculaceae bacterium]|nr:UDP-3-O-acyl-N-acetylglucosamine deacetylase [Muribaculaceae bacterium]
MNQLTLKSPFTVSGKGLHSGCAVEAVFNPAAENTGIKFRRIDMEGAP